MLKILNRNLRRLYSRLRWPLRRHSNPKIIIRRFGHQNHKPQSKVESNEHLKLLPDASKQIRIATFNAAMFSMAPAVPESKKSVIVFDYEEEEEEERRYLNSKTPRGVEIDIRSKSANDRPKSILKQSPSHSYSMSSSIEKTLSKQQRVGNSKLRVSINLPDNQISLERRTRRLNFIEDDKAGPSNTGRDLKGKAPMRSSWSFPNHKARDSESLRTKRTVLEVLKEVDADILALQDVKADEAKGMKPLSDLANALGMKYVFAESWAPEYGNAILSKWPIKRWRIQKIYDDTDFRNVLKATVDVPQAGEVNFHCTQLDHLDEDWRMKQITAIIQSEDVPNILAGGLNSLDQTDYSLGRMTDIVKYYEEIGKPTPKVEVMKFLKEKKYVDAKLFAGECEAVVMIAKGQDVQGTCKYGTRVDYILSSPDSPYKFVPGSYAVISSKGTSDHHIVKVDIKVANATENATGYQRRRKKKVVKITNPSSRSIWTTRS
ncbi:DNAse I-like superfamily protein [Cinnamomum micranthum f. kanehirae]|uniref:DNAse I-like superfamily protein n=1 Tax=Cinnamomum micranthum f. kanehirae TaxID=337451 RepID=A0A443NDI6_9MAGN|nr:DNAse I-like superfamily protein [Cinnamomum micranthum f. kanehirae]